MLNYKNIVNGILTGGLLLSFLTGCKQPQQEFTNTSTPTPTLEQVITQTPQARDAQANPTPTAIPFIPTPFPHDEKSGMPLDSRLAFVAQDQDYVQDIWILNGSELRRMTHDTFIEHDLSWSPDGKRIAYVQDNFAMDEFDVLRVMNVETGESEIVYPAQGEELRNVVWNPEKNVIVFEEEFGDARLNEDNEVIKNVRLSSIDLDTYRVTNLVDLTRGALKIEWVNTDKFWYLDLNGWSVQSVDIYGINHGSVSHVDWFDVSNDRSQRLVVTHDSTSICGETGDCEDVTERLDEAPLSSTLRMTYPLLMNNRGIIDENYSQYGEKELFLIKTDPNFFVRELLAPDMAPYTHDDLYLEEASLSIDDNQLIFSADRDNYEENYLLSLDGRHLRELDFGREYPFFSNMHSFAWSPVKEDLTLVSNEDIEIVDNYRVAQPIPLDGTLVFLAWDSNGRQSLWKLEDGEVEDLVNDDWGDEKIEFEVSPSGKEIFVFQRSATMGRGSLIDINEENMDPFLTFPTLNFDTTGIDTNNVYTHSFEWSPDGSRIAYLQTYYKDNNGDGEYKSNERQTDLFFLNLETYEVPRVLEDVSTFEWAPDGKTLLAILDDYYLAEYWFNDEIDSASTGYFDRRGHYEGSDIKYSPNGDKILISSSDGFYERLYVADVHSNYLDNIHLIEDNYSGRGAAWSPDGQKIVYSVFNHEIKNENQYEFRSELFVINPDGTEKEEIHEFLEVYKTDVPFNTNYYVTPIFSPDGETIIFRAFQMGCGDIYAINVDGSDFRDLFENSTQFKCIDFNPMTGDTIVPDYEFIP